MPLQAEISSFSNSLDKISQVRVLCIGDVMLDRFYEGTAERISPEAPIPVFTIRSESMMLGGAGNVVRNLCALGVQANLIAVIGDDAAGKAVTRLAAEETGLEAHFITDAARPTTEKSRFVAASQHMLRVDHETSAPLAEKISGKLLALAEQGLAQAQALILSDYGKGVLSEYVIATLIAMARRQGIPVLVDPKKRDFSVYADATVLCPNLKELTQAAGEELYGDEAIACAAHRLVQAHRLRELVVTRGREGVTLVSTGMQDQHLPAEAREVYDVSGAGDTFIACLAACYAAGISLKSAANLANLAAGIAVGRKGTATVSLQDIRAALLTRGLTQGTGKLHSRAEALRLIDGWRAAGQTIGFTNGCFDLVHPGHISLLSQAKTCCDRLVVGLNSDASVKRLKGPTRPVQSEFARAVVLASLQAVDMVVIFDEDTPQSLIEAVRPDILVKGADYSKEQVVGGAFVESYGGRVILAALTEGQSTSKLIRTMHAGG